MNHTAALHLRKTDNVQSKDNWILAKVILETVTLLKLPTRQNTVLSAEKFASLRLLVQLLHSPGGVPVVPLLHCRL